MFSITDRRGRLHLATLFISAMLLALALPPLNLGFLAWFALTPFMFVMEKLPRVRDGYLAGFLFGLVYFGIAMHWIGFNSGTTIGVRIGSAAGGVLLLTSSFGFMTWGYAAVLKAFERAGHLFAPMLWIGFETVWHLGELAFPWPLVALTQAKYLPVLQLASVGGTALMTGVVVLANAMLVAGRERRVASILFFLLIGGTLLFGQLRLRSVVVDIAGNKIGRVALVQGNIDAAKKWKLGADYSMDVYLPLTRSLDQEKPDLVVWPETAAPVYVQQDYRWRRRLQEEVDTLGFALITGGRYADFTDNGRIPYNPAFLIQPHKRGQFERYSKVHLVPFGERVAFQWLIPALGNLNLGQAEFKPGKGTAVWRIDGVQDTFTVAPLICYESIFPDLGQKAVRGGADVLLNLTNDGWYDDTAELEQHLMLSRIRAVETGRSLVRATNTGISAMINPAGHLTRILGNKLRGALVEDLAPPVNTTFNRGGWVLSYLGLIAALLVVTISMLRLKRQQLDEKEEER
ncbi:apolipoprotein N-acyltransferase [bacterium]|nr:apolipoprotein N-acyltransferase [bacterium]